MIRSIAAAGLILLAPSAFADTLRLAHHYKATGQGPSGSKYTADVTVEITSDTTFSIRWDMGGGTVYDGFGMRRNDMLTAAFMNDKATGLVIYQVQGDGLDGIWTFKGDNGVGTEHLTPVD